MSVVADALRWLSYITGRFSARHAQEVLFRPLVTVLLVLGVLCLLWGFLGVRRARTYDCLAFTDT